MSRKTIEYRRFKILLAGTYHERYVVEVAGEWFHFPTLEKAQAWVDFVCDANVSYNSNVTC